MLSALQRFCGELLSTKHQRHNCSVYLRGLLHLLHHPLVLLGNGQCGWVDPLVDHLALPRLECEQTLSCVTHPAPATHKHTHTQPDREKPIHFDHSPIYKFAQLNVRRNDSQKRLSHHRLKGSAAHVYILGSFAYPGFFEHNWITICVVFADTHLPDSKVNQVESRPYRRSELRGHMTSFSRGLRISQR